MPLPISRPTDLTLRLSHLEDRLERLEDEGYRDRLLTPKELLKRIPVSRRTLDGWMKSKKIPYLKIQRGILFRWSAVEEALGEKEVCYSPLGTAFFGAPNPLGGILESRMGQSGGGGG